MAALEIKIIETELGFLLQIVKQDYRGDSFNCGTDVFRANSGFYLESQSYLAYENCNLLYVRGNNSDEDNKVIFLQNNEETRIYIQKLKQAIREYNKAMEDRTDEVCKVEIIK